MITDAIKKATGVNVQSDGSVDVKVGGRDYNIKASVSGSTVGLRIKTNFDCLEGTCDQPLSCESAAALREFRETVLSQEYSGCNANVMPSPDGGDVCYNIFRKPANNPEAIRAIAKKMCDMKQGIMTPDNGHQTCKVPAATPMRTPLLDICNDPAAMCLPDGQGTSKPLPGVELPPSPGPVPIR